jgi:hypothetical protein
MTSDGELALCRDCCRLVIEIVERGLVLLTIGADSSRVLRARAGSRSGGYCGTAPRWRHGYGGVNLDLGEGFRSADSLPHSDRDERDGEGMLADEGMT